MFQSSSSELRFVVVKWPRGPLLLDVWQLLLPSLPQFFLLLVGLGLVNGCLGIFCFDLLVWWCLGILPLLLFGFWSSCIHRFINNGCIRNNNFYSLTFSLHEKIPLMPHEVDYLLLSCLISFNPSRILAPNRCPPSCGGLFDALVVMASPALILFSFLSTLTPYWIHSLVMMAGTTVLL